VPVLSVVLLRPAEEGSTIFGRLPARPWTLPKAGALSASSVVYVPGVTMISSPFPGGMPLQRPKPSWIVPAFSCEEQSPLPFALGATQRSAASAGPASAHAATTAATAKTVEITPRFNIRRVRIEAPFSSGRRLGVDGCRSIVDAYSV